MPGQKKNLKSHIYPSLCLYDYVSGGFWMMCIYHKNCFYISYIKKKGLKSVLCVTPNVKTIVVLIYDSYGSVLRN